jgi:transposase InsO family protein
LLIRRISREHPAWGEDRIRDELRLKLGVEHSTSTIRKYMVSPEERGPLEERARSQTWRTFLKNHAKETYACDFLVQWTATFRLVYVFVVMDLGSRRIVHANVTSSPTLAWVKNQMREIAAWGEGPRFLIHDNDGIFGQLGRRKHGFRCHLDRWLWRVIGIKGIPIPYHSPNANSYVERFNLSLRREALDHFIFLNERHVLRVVKNYVAFYNGARGHQGIGTIPDPYDELREPPRDEGRVVALPVLGGIQHDYRRAA